MMVRFEYMFRDECNYKEYGFIDFSNANKFPIEKINKVINETLVEGISFDPDLWDIPRFSFHRNFHFGFFEHVWYEFVDVYQIDEKINTNRDICDFMNHILLKNMNQ